MAYPSVFWIDYILLFMVIAIMYLFMAERTKRHAERDSSTRQLSDQERDSIREEIYREMQAERKSFMKSIVERDAAFAEREQILTREYLRIQSAEKIAIAKQAEYETALVKVTSKTDQLNYWLSQVDCAIEALVEDHGASGKMSQYLGQWVDKATSDPAGFAADLTIGKFDPKRFERSKRQLEKIYERYAAIQRELGNTAKILNEGDADALDQK